MWKWQTPPARYFEMGLGHACYVLRKEGSLRSNENTATMHATTGKHRPDVAASLVNHPY